MSSSQQEFSLAPSLRVDLDPRCLGEVGLQGQLGLEFGGNVKKIHFDNERFFEVFVNDECQSFVLYLFLHKEPAGRNFPPGRPSLLGLWLRKSSSKEGKGSEPKEARWRFMLPLIVSLNSFP